MFLKKAFTTSGVHNLYLPGISITIINTTTAMQTTPTFPTMVNTDSICSLL